MRFKNEAKLIGIDLFYFSILYVLVTSFPTIFLDTVKTLNSNHEILALLFVISVNIIVLGIGYQFYNHRQKYFKEIQ